MSGAELAVSLIQKGCWAAVATLGFSILFNVPKYALPYCALIGAFGYALRAALTSGGLGMVSATLCAALLIGVMATILAQRYGVSGTLFAVGPAIPLVPGSYAYKAVMGIVMVAESPQLERSTELLLTAFDNGIKAVLTILFLSFGIALPGLAWSALQREN
ncbi:MAG TPA: threonine/serine exporter family protein [Candidatus Competibacter sp.]|nr:threonine/serine exporter family protein [Candidatus Competibacter sp.]